MSELQYSNGTDQADQSDTPATEHITYIFETYNDRERLYAQYEIAKPRFAVWFERALKKGDLSTDSAEASWRMLDAGCGEGLYSLSVMEQFPKVEIVGIDRDNEAILTANMIIGPGSKGQAKFFVHNLLQPLPAYFTDPAQPAGTEGVNGDGFDIALAWYVLMHLKPAEQGLANLANALKPGGVILLNDAVEDWATFPHPSFTYLIKLMTQAGQRISSFDFAERHVAALEALGFETIESEYFDAPLGGPTAYGQKIFSHVIASVEAARAGLVEKLHVISGEEFDEHIRRIKTESTTQQQGYSKSVVTVARKKL